MLCIRGAATVDTERGTVEQHDWTISDLGLLADMDSDHAVGGDGQVMAAEGLYLLPGLIDAHVHIGRPRERSFLDNQAEPGQHIVRNLQRTVCSGVTTIRDMGDRWPDSTQIIGTAIASGTVRIVSALSGLTVAGGYGAFLGEALRDRDEARAAVGRRYHHGAKLIKLFLTGGVDFTTGTVGPMQFDLPAVEAVAIAAHDLGLRLAVHANGAEAVKSAVLAGADSIEHGILLDHEALTLILDNGVYWVPTLTPLHRSVMPDSRATRTLELRALRDVIAQHEARVAEAFQMGIKVIAGTDAGSPGVPHGCVVDELEHFVAAGVRPELALKSATVWAARALGLEWQVGAIAPGLCGDVVLLGADPLHDVGALRSIRRVVCGGRLVEWTEYRD